ncbi:hypothetical protein PRUPE_7G037400 [Prunus persica]|uniref:Uncharacterized protein n=2 Tax=Prunus persica TaxID=3760 RepID=M5VU85_PRUPE|nr:UPF0481 protein At3g47200 isoform X2 [Prunus persica]ONH94886.1 hypothetical protein PRUPE_7G037400 [Prunus persica]
MAIETECSPDRPYIVGEDNLIEALKESMSKKLGPAAKSPLTVRTCIFKVPPVLRRHKPEAYEPHVISIGPIHRDGRKQFQRMETVKLWYLKTLLSRMNLSLEKFIDGFNEFLLHEHEEKGIIEFGKGARDFYEEPLDFNDKEFMEIMILDGCFVIQLVRKFIAHWENDDDPILNEEKEDDPILNMDCMFQYVCHDLLLLENQLPWSVLSCLYRFTLGKSNGGPLFGFSGLLLRFFSPLSSLRKYCDSYMQDHMKPDLKVDENGVLHILDLIRTSIVFSFQPSKSSSRNDQNYLWWFAEKEEKEIGPEIQEIPAATALSEAGVKFERGSDNNLMNIEFKDGVLTIPELAVGELTEPLFRNLIAFEQCYHGRSQQITSYAVFMDKLINSDKDIKLLSEKKILANWLSVEDGSNFFNKLYIDTIVKEFHYDKLCAEVNKYYQVGWHKQLEILTRDHFANPWKIISLIAGIILLVLTLLQTIFTISQ